MSDALKTELAEITKQLWQIQNASQVLAQMLELVASEPADDQGRQMERLHGVAFLMDLVNGAVDQAQVALINVINAQ